MSAKIRLAGTLSQNPQKAVTAMYICFLTIFYRATINEHTSQ